jgi:hypothetical protein
MPRAHYAKDSEFKIGSLAPQDHMALAPHDFTALAPHDYTAPAPHDCTALAPSPRASYPNNSEFKARYANNSEFKFETFARLAKIANSSCPSTGPSKTLCVYPLLARIEPSFGFTSRTQRPLRQCLNPSLPLVASPIPHP